MSKRFKKDRPHLPPLPIGKILGKRREDGKSSAVSKNKSKAMISSQAGSEDKGLQRPSNVFDGRKEFAAFRSQINDPLYGAIVDKKSSNDLQ